jgi:hypothetical protein
MRRVTVSIQETAAVGTESYEALREAWLDVLGSGQGDELTRWHRAECKKLADAASKEDRKRLLEDVYGQDSIDENDIDPAEVRMARILLGGNAKGSARLPVEVTDFTSGFNQYMLDNPEQRTQFCHAWSQGHSKKVVALVAEYMEEM